MNIRGDPWPCVILWKATCPQNAQHYLGCLSAPAPRDPTRRPLRRPVPI